MRNGYVHEEKLLLVQIYFLEDLQLLIDNENNCLILEGCERVHYSKKGFYLLSLGYDYGADFWRSLLNVAFYWQRYKQGILLKCFKIFGGTFYA